MPGPDFRKMKTGKLKAGMLADLTVLSEDLFSIAPENIRNTKVLAHRREWKRSVWSTC